MADAADSYATRQEQSPGFFRMRMGKYTVTALYDGTVMVNSLLMKGRSQPTITRMLRQTRQPRDISTSINDFLINDGERIILIDTGASTALGASRGKMLESLELSGYAPQDVQYVLLTHLHPDHASGLLHEGKPAFPNAQIYIPQAELDECANEKHASLSQPVFRGVINALEPYQRTGKIHGFEPGSEPILGVRSIALPGHSPGHAGYRIRAGNESLLVWGDLVYNAPMQFIDPMITLEFDSDQKTSRLTRTRVLREAASSGEWIAGSHLPFPGIGRVQAVGKTSYRWLPIEYAHSMLEPAQRQPVSNR